MATYTENYNLEKPAQSDLYNVDVFNENADKIDEALGDKAENQSLAPIESSSTASRNYSVGQQFVYNGLLYEATAAIASGGTITPGSNCARTTVAEELSALNDSLANIGTFIAREGVTTSVATKSLGAGQKFSDYVVLAFIAQINNTVRGSLWIPVSKFSDGQDCYIVGIAGTTVTNMYIKYVSDTSFSVKCDDSRFNYISIYGG